MAQLRPKWENLPSDSSPAEIMHQSHSDRVQRQLWRAGVADSMSGDKTLAVLPDFGGLRLNRLAIHGSTAYL